MTDQPPPSPSLPEEPPSEQDIQPLFAPYKPAAGGWGALRATAKALREQSIALKGSKTLLSMNQPEGFDCPGCAWPDPRHTSSFEFCENGAKAVAFELTKRRVTREFFAAHTVRALEQQSDYWLEEQGRLTEPMRYDASTDRYVPIEWPDAFALIARELNVLDSPNEAEFYTSGRSSNEAAFMYQLFTRRFGTNNFPDCSNMCHEPTSVGLPESIGIGKGTVILEDFDHAEAIFIIGQNPGTNSPRMMTELHKASRQEIPIVVFNPLRERALERFAAPQDPVEMATFGETRIASEFCQLRVGGDVAALKGVMKLALEAHEDALRRGADPVLDLDFIAKHTYGFDAFAEDLRNTSWDDILRVSGLTRRQLERVAAIYVQARSVIVCYGMGITQHRLGTANVQQIVNLLLLRGNFGKAGAGICPVRGHSNVQGDRTVGVDERPKPEFLDQLKAVFGFDPPRAHGHNVVNAVQAMIDGRAKVFIGLGGNFVRAVPDWTVAEAAMRGLRLTVAINTKLNRGHLVHGQEGLILPCLARSDIDQMNGRQSVTVEDSMSMVHASSGLVEPPSPNLKSEVAIVCGMAKATLPHCGIDWDFFVADYDRIRDKIEAVFPHLFADFNKRIRVPGGFHLTNPPRQRLWNTSTGRANFLVFPGIDENPPVSDPGMLRLATLRSHDQYNTTIYSLDDRYRGVFGGRMVVFMNEADMRAREISEGDLVEIESLAEDGKRRILGGFGRNRTISLKARLALIIQKLIRSCRLPIMISRAARQPLNRSQCSFAVRENRSRQRGSPMSTFDKSRLVPRPTRRVLHEVWRNGSVLGGERTLAEEVPVAFSYDGATHAVLMATPEDLEDFAIGFSHTEGIITAASEISELTVASVVEGVVLRMWLSNARSDAFAARRRRYVGPAGCGMCGLESLTEASRTVPVIASDLQVNWRHIRDAGAVLPEEQALNKETRAVHAAAFCEPGGSLLVREDVGRHNALDKLAGALLRTGRSAADGIVVLSSRLSIELIQKAAMIGAPLIVGVSAPTAFAVRAAETSGITLVGIARNDGFEVFTHPERLRGA